jgi:hypothetical protein
MPAPTVTWTRTLRTPHSERFVAMVGGREAAAVDLHYLVNGHASGTVIILDGAGIGEEQVPDLLRSLDEGLLPDVDLMAGSLTYAVVFGRLVGMYEATAESPAPGRDR